MRAARRLQRDAPSFHYGLPALQARGASLSPPTDDISIAADSATWGGSRVLSSSSERNRVPSRTAPPMRAIASGLNLRTIQRVESYPASPVNDEVFTDIVLTE